jgi:CopG family nickel-responsive transcriptional regulator
VRFSVSTDPELLEEFDELVHRIGYNRSNAIQAAMRGFISDNKWTLEPGARIVGAITMIYDHEVRGVGEALTHIQHNYRKEVNSTTHIHLDENNCLEILAVEGKVERIQGLAKELMTTRGVKQLKIVPLIP